MMYTYQCRDIPSLFPAAITYITTKVISLRQSGKRETAVGRNYNERDKSS